jgi:hypothetical protein
VAPFSEKLVRASTSYHTMTRRSDSESRAGAWRESHGEPLDDVAALAFHLRARAALERAIGILEEASVPALVVKGALLAHTLYQSPIDRPIRDVDLRVLPAHVGRAGDLLAATPGSRLLVRSRVYGTSVVSFRKVEIDLESAIGPPFLCAVDIASLLRRAERTAQGLGFPHLRPELHDHALLLIVNLFKDRIRETPEWKLRDLVLLAGCPGFDPRRLVALAEDARCTTIAHVVARHVARAVPDERWADIAARIRPVRPAYAARLLAIAERTRRPPLLSWQLDARAGSDSRARSLAAIGATVLREIEQRAGHLRRR